jgi:hypothetical protein
MLGWNTNKKRQIPAMDAKILDLAVFISPPPF